MRVRPQSSDTALPIPETLVDEIKVLHAELEVALPNIQAMFDRLAVLCKKVDTVLGPSEADMYAVGFEASGMEAIDRLVDHYGLLSYEEARYTHLMERLSAWQQRHLVVTSSA
jgi:hypothetical protein